MSKVVYNESCAVILFDCSLPKEERIKNPILFNSIVSACNYIGLRQDKIYYYASMEARRKQRRFVSKKHNGKEFAIRFAPSR